MRAAAGLQVDACDAHEANAAGAARRRHRERPHEILARVIETEQGMLVFRQRHARMVERVIGRRVGTGGSGVDYLDETTKYRVFKDLWTARTFLVKRDA